MPKPARRIRNDNAGYIPTNPERYVALGLTVFIVLFCSVFVLLPEPIKDPNAVVLVRIMLSVACGVLGGIIPGFLHVDIKGRGLAIRAVGGIAVTIITFFFTPTVITNLKTRAELNLERYQTGDVNTALNGINGYWDLPVNARRYLEATPAARQDMVLAWLDVPEKQNQVRTVVNYMSELDRCINEKDCSPRKFCEAVFSDLDNFMIFFWPYLEFWGSAEYGYDKVFISAQRFVNCHCYKERNAVRCRNNPSMCNAAPTCSA